MARRFSLLLGLAFACCLAAAPGPATAASAGAVIDLSYDLDGRAPADSNLNRLDLYLPAEPDHRAAGLRPVVVWVHGGGWMTGDKSNRMADKARLFNELGYLVASVNYRLSPAISRGDASQAFAPGRVRAPEHVRDVAEAIGWLSRNLSSYGGDPDRLILVGHSAGAHLVSLAGTAPEWIKARNVSPRQILGVVSLDTETFDVRAEADARNPLNRPSRLALIWHAFGTPAEEAADPRWAAASPLVHAGPADPPFLFVTQGARPLRIAGNREMAVALGQDPDASVVGVPLDHEGINTSLGSPLDPTAETSRVSRFVRDAVASARPAGVKITRRPPRRVRVRVPRHRHRARLRKVVFAFKGTGRATGFRCRIDRRKFAKCRSPKIYRLRPGRHTFRVRPLYPSGRPGNERKASFRILARRARG